MQVAEINFFGCQCTYMLLSDHRPNLCKNRWIGTGELYIPQESWPFSSSFLTLFLYMHISFEYFYRFNRHTRTYCKDSSVKISIIVVYMVLWKSSKMDLGRLSFFAYFSSPDFQTLSNWARMLKLSVWVGTTFLYEAFTNYCNRVLLSPSGPPKEFPPKFLHLLCDFDEIWITTFLYVYQ